ncbi:MAG: UDP-2,3-diacylglucosamine diphosphatase [Pseudomonadota bacterium]
MFDPDDRQRYRTLFISDVHLGMKNCQAEALLDFLKHTDAQTIVLVGDIVDFWKVKRGAWWPQAHNDVVQKLLRAARKGTRIIYIPGNHDEGLRGYCGQAFGGVELHTDHIFTSAAGKRYLVLHGDVFDTVVRHARWLAYVGDRGYSCALWVNRPLNWVRRRLGFGYWSLSGYLKHHVKRAMQYIGAFEDAVVSEARARKVDGVICGHIHTPAERVVDGVHYLNCGDWVENCTAIGETSAGTFELIYWHRLSATYGRRVALHGTLEAA